MMVTSPEKSTAIWFCKDPQVPLHLGGSCLAIASTLKSLGVWLDKKLKFTKHVEKSIEKGYTKLGLIQKMTRLPYTFGRMYVQSVIIPTVFFVGVVWIWGISQTTWAKIDQFLRQCLLKLTSSFKTSSYATLYLLTGFLFSQWQAYLLAGRCFIRFDKQEIRIQWSRIRNSNHTKLHKGYDTILEQSQVTESQLALLRTNISSWSHATGSMEQAILRQKYSNLQD